MFSCLVGERELGCNWELSFLRVFLCTIVSPYFIVKSLQLRGCRQIAESRKHCLVRVIVFFGVCFLYLFCFSQLGIWLNSLQLISEPRVRFEWEQWQRKQERRLE